MTKAFSLVELLVALGVLGIALGLGVPSIQSYTIRSQLNQTAEELATLVKQVAARALNTSEGHRLNVPLGSILSWGPDRLDGQDVNVKLSHGVLKSCTLADGTSCGGLLSFSGRGLPAAQYNLTLEHRGRTQKVVVLLTGKAVIPR